MGRYKLLNYIYFFSINMNTVEKKMEIYLHDPLVIWELLCLLFPSLIMPCLETMSKIPYISQTQCNSLCTGMDIFTTSNLNTSVTSTKQYEEKFW